MLKTFFKTTVFPSIHWKCMKWIFWNRLVASNNFITLIKFLYHILFYGKLFENIFLGVVFDWSQKFWVAGLQRQWKRRFLQVFFRNFRNFRKFFLSELFKKNICRGVFRSAVGCTLFWCNRIKKKLYYIHFSAALSTYPWIKLYVTKFLELLDVDYSAN